MNTSLIEVQIPHHTPIVLDPTKIRGLQLRKRAEFPGNAVRWELWLFWDAPSGDSTIILYTGDLVEETTTETVKYKWLGIFPATKEVSVPRPKETYEAERVQAFAEALRVYRSVASQLGVKVSYQEIKMDGVESQ